MLECLFCWKTEDDAAIRRLFRLSQTMQLLELEKEKRKTKEQRYLVIFKYCLLLLLLLFSMYAVNRIQQQQKNQNLLWKFFTFLVTAAIPTVFTYVHTYLCVSIKVEFAFGRFILGRTKVEMFVVLLCVQKGAGSGSTRGEKC